MPAKQHRVQLWVVALAFALGMAVDSWLRVYGPPLPSIRPAGETSPALPHGAESKTEPAPAPPPPRAVATPPPKAVATTGNATKLRLPVEGIDVDVLKGGFNEARAGHRHEAVDMLSPRNTPVHAVEDGTIAKLFVSKAGGNTIYQFDPTGRYAFYYAHLERYETGLREGAKVARGEVIGYVGTSGNAPPETPHLHFAVFELGPERQWWKGKAVDPYPMFR